MKKHFLHLLFIFFCVSLSSQTPQKFTYQSVVRSSDGNVLKSANIGIRFSILQNSNIGKTVYRERHSTETNSNGMISLSIGDGTTSDNFSAIDWSTGEYFLRIEVDPLGGSNYLIQSTSQLLSVPYALYAGSSNTNLLLSGENYLTYSNNELRLKKINLSTNTNGVLPVNSGGTGVNTAPMISLIKAADAAGAREILGVESSSDEDNSTPVTLTTVTGNYLTIDGQEITAGIVPISLGGTGVNSTPMIGVITASNAAAARTALGAGTIATQNNTAVNIDGGSIDGTPVGGTLKSTGAFTIVSSAIYQSNDNTDLTLKTGSAVTGNITIANGANGNINISPDGTGQVVIDNLKFPNSFGNSNQVLKTNGSGTLSWADEADGSTAVTLATVTDNYLAISEQTITAGTVPISLGGTGSTTAPMIGLVTAENAAAARNALGVDASGTDGSTAVTLATVTDNYLAISGQAITAGMVPISLGGTGSATAPMIGLVTAADAAAARTALGVDASGTDGSTAVTLATVTDNYLAISGQAITAGTVPISLGGTGSTTAPMIGLVTAADAAAARTALGVDASGTDGSTAVTLATVTDNYLAISGQAITAGMVPISLGGTGSATAPMIGLVTAADAAAARTALGAGTIVTQDNDAVNIDGGAIDGTSIGASTASTGVFTSVSSGVIQSVGDTDIVIKTGNGTTGTITITDGADGNINISPNGTGKVVLDNLTFPPADGAANQILKTDGSGALGWIDNTVAINPGGDGIEVGDGSGVGKVESKGDHDLTIRTGNATSGDITIVNGSNGDIRLSPNGTGKVAVSSDLAINTNKFTVLAASGNIGAAGTLEVAGNSTLAGALSVTGNIGTSGTLGVTGASTLSGALNVTGATTLTGALNVTGASSVTGATTIIGDLSVGGSNQELRFYEGSNYVGFEAPALAADKIWVLPAADGSANEILKTDGSGALSWTTNVSGASNIGALSEVLIEDNSLYIGHDPVSNTSTAQWNVSVGVTALDAITSGDENTAMGYKALSVLSSGSANTAIGKEALSMNNGSRNTALGYLALWKNTSGNDNNALGENALRENSAGSHNTAIGDQALEWNMQSHNTAVGSLAMKGTSNDNSNNSTALGYKAGYVINDGDNNVFIGYQAGDAVTSGDNNIIIGADAAASAVTADNQIVIGQGATGTTDNTVLLGNGSITNWLPTDTNEVDLGSSSKEMKNIYVDGVAYTDAIGFGTVAMTLPTADGSADQVLKTDGSGNLGWTAAGGGGAIDGLSDAKLEGTDFTGSMILGHQTTGTLDAAESNTAVGIGSLDAITSGDRNTAIGNNSLTATTSGNKNVAIGNESLSGNTSGERNTAVGDKAMFLNETGVRNAAFGYVSGKSGSYNAAFGAYSLTAVTGNSNTAVGYYAGAGDGVNTAITTGANNVIVGYQAGVDDAAAANRIVIGSGTDGLDDNTVTLGNGSITNWLPTDTNEVDLGSSTKEMKDIYVDGVAYTDAIGFGTVAMTLPTADGSADQVLKTDGSGALGWATVSGGGGSLAQLTENSKTGYRLSEADANNYGEIGASAVDLSISSTASSTKGATGTNSFATNISTASGTQSFAAGSSFASGTQSTAFGYNNNSPGQFSFATGQGSYSYGARSTTLGMANQARGTLSVTTGAYTVARDYGTLVIGQYNSVGNLAVTSNGSGTVFDTDNSAFVIGNGESGSLSDAFVVYSNGNTTTSGDLSLGGSNKELRFYEGANYVGFEAPALSADKIWVLPAADGSADQVLKTNGSGALGWADISGATYTVNTFYAELGGYVIEVRDGGKHGLVVAMQNQGLINWYGANELLNDPDKHDANGDKFMDWRLPTKRELNLIYVNYNSGDNGASLAGESYHTSSLYDNSQYWYQYFHNGNQAYVAKGTNSYVRAVRAF